MDFLLSFDETVWNKNPGEAMYYLKEKCRKRLLLGIFLKNATVLFGLVISHSKFPIEVPMAPAEFKGSKGQKQCSSASNAQA